MQKRLLIIGTGGTIAGVAAQPGQTVGYRAGALPIGQLLSAIPALDTLAQIEAEQWFSVASEQMSSQHWLDLASGLRARLEGPEPPDAIVITHGTDTLEETAFFLSLVLPASRPVLLTGAMRPATALNADGPGNVYNACCFALAARDAGIGGVFVSFGERVIEADRVMKVHANDAEAFQPRFGTAAGWLENGCPRWRTDAHRPPAGALAGTFASMGLPSGSGLPPVALLMQHVDADPMIVPWLLQRGHRGIVLAGTGIGTMPAAMREALTQARQAGCQIVRSTRLTAGFVGRNTEPEAADRDDARDFIASGWLAPHKARILLQLCLAAGMTDSQQIQACFDRAHP
ncbi:MAG: asparaginase [Lautropia sp.]|nr:asparaginase [Lautropia sp.]